MVGRRHMAAVWLLSISVVSGCAGGPSRSLFARRPKAATTEDEYARRLISDANRLAQKGDMNGARHLLDEAHATQGTTDTEGSASRPLASPKRRPLELPDEAVAQVDQGFHKSDDTSAKVRLNLDEDETEPFGNRSPSRQRPSSGAQFDVSSRSPLAGFAPIEAPIPKRRTGPTNDQPKALPPRDFSAAAGARALPTLSSPTNSRSEPRTAEFTADLSTFQTQPVSQRGTSVSDPFARRSSDIVNADFQTDSTDSGIVPAGGNRRAGEPQNRAASPWNQFRELTDPSNRQANEAMNSGAEAPPSNPFSSIGSPENMSGREPPQASNGNSLNDSGYANWPPNSQPMPNWTRSSPPFSQSGAVASSASTDSASNTLPVWPGNSEQHFGPGSSSQITTPEPWPPGSRGSSIATSNDRSWAQAPNGYSNFLAEAGQQPTNIQQTNASSPDMASTSGFGFPPNSQPNMPASPMTPLVGNGFSERVPPAVGPFSTSPELEQAILQTTVELSAMVPGETDTQRQLFLRKHVQLRLLALIAGQTDRALQPVPNIDPADQEFWQQMLWGLANYFDVQGMPDSSERATQTIAQLQVAALRLQEKARLELHNVAFCHKITSFGNYQRFKRDEFTPGQPVLLYAEVKNFKSETTSDGQFRSLMKSSVEVLEGGPQGRVIESVPFSPSEDRCRNQRHDYFHSYEFAIPQGIHPGPHTLRLTVEDQLGKKSSVTTLSFTVQ